MKKIVLLLLTICSLSGCSIASEQDPRSLSTAWKDNKLTLSLVGITNKEPYSGDLRLNAIIYNGNAILLGQSRTQELKTSLIEKVRAMEGINKVFDQIHIKEPISISQRSRDTWLTTKVKTAILSQRDLLTANIKVVTENNEVFLFGYVTPEQAKLATEISRNISDVERVIQAWF